MEVQTADLLFRDWIQRSKALVRTLEAADLSKQKELRQFPTNCFPVLFAGRTLEDSISKPLLKGSIDVLSLSQAVIRLLCRNRDFCDNQLRVKPSRKVHAIGCSQTHLVSLTRSIKAIESYGRMGTLELLLTRSGMGRLYAEAMSGPICQNLYVRDLLNVLSGDAIPSKADWDAFLGSWTENQPVQLKSRLDPNVGEPRAFAVDKSATRSLVGSILHSLLHQKRTEPHLLPPYSTNSPPVGKHLITATYDIKAENELTLAFVDISSFTASFKNIWVVLINTIHVLEQSGNDEPLVVDVNGSLLETRKIEVLRLFLRLASGVKVEYDGTWSISLGGMLGISGIDTLAKVVYALIIDQLTEFYRRGLQGLYSRVGGDDIILFTISKKTKPHAARETILAVTSEIREVVGAIKDQDCMFRIPYNFDGYAPYPFCKKELRIVSQMGTPRPGRQSIQLQSQFRIPMYSVLFNSRQWSQVDIARGFWSSLKSVPWVPENMLIRSVLFAIFMRNIDAHLHEENASRGVHFSGQIIDGCSVKARDTLLGVTPVADSTGQLYKTTLAARYSSIKPGTLLRIFAITQAGNFPLTVHASERVRPDTPLILEKPDRYITLPTDLAEAVDLVRAQLEGNVF